MPDVLNCDDPNCAEPLATGGKASSLAMLNHLEGVRVPWFFAVTTTAYVDAIAAAGLSDAIEGLQGEADRRQLYARAAVLREQIAGAPISERTARAVTGAYAELCRVVDLEDAAVAVRSSATTEDLEEGSFAGQHSSFLNIRGVEDLLQAVRECWASVFNDRAVEYRNTIGIAHREALVGVVVQKMVFPEVAGTAFSIEIGTSFPGLHVAATYGLGESLVSGEVTSDEWLLDPDDLRLIKRVRGSKRFKYRILEASSGIEKVEISGGADYCLDLDMVKEIAARTQEIAAWYRENHGYEHIDTEFAVSQTPTLYFLQARPVVPVIWEDVHTVDGDHVKPSDVLIRGKYSLIGATHGRLRIIDDFNALVEERVTIEAEDIVVAVKTSNYWNQYLTHLRGIITMEGSPTAHPMLIGRERNLPCLIGCPDVLERLRPHDRTWVTLDGLRKQVYRGKKPLIPATQAELNIQFKPVPVETLGSEEESLSFLKSFGRVHDDGAGGWWVANPNHALSPAWQQMTIDGLSRRMSMVNACRAQPGEDPFEPGGLVFDGKVHDRLQPLARTISAFDGMNLEECTAFLQGYRGAGADYLAACEGLATKISVATWRAYASAYADLSAHAWLSWFFRTWLDIEVSGRANALRVSQFHFARWSDRLQSQIPQEDDRLTREILALCADITDDGLEHIARRYRIAKDTDIRHALPLQETRNLVLDEAASGGVLEGPASDDDGQDFFLEDVELSAWTRLSIAARIQHCDTHHIRMRGQWRVREALMETGDVFDLPMESIEAILGEA